MMNFDDDFDLSFDVLSSPVAASETIPQSNAFTFDCGSFFEDEPLSDNSVTFTDESCSMKTGNKQMFPRYSSLPEFDLNNKSFSGFEIVQPTPIIPKAPKKKSVVFQPFSSFEAAELTVKALKETSCQAAINRSAYW